MQEERVRSRREAFLKQMQDKERAAEARKKARAAANENQKVGGVARKEIRLRRRFPTKTSP